MTNSFAMFMQPLIERQKTVKVVQRPQRRKSSPTALPVNFEKRIIELEFKVEKGDID